MTTEAPAQSPVPSPIQTETGPTVQVNSEQFFSDAPAPAPAVPAQSTPPAPAPAAPAQSAPPAPAAPSAEPIISTPPATTPPATTTPPAVADADDPWAGFATDDDPTATAPPATEPVVDERVSMLAQSLGIEQLPETPEELATAFNNEIERRVSLLTHDPIQRIDAQLALSDTDLVRARLSQTRQDWQTQEDVDNQLQQIEDDNRLDLIANQIRQGLRNTRETEVTRKDNEILQQQQQSAEAERQQRQAFQTAQREFVQAVDEFKDPANRPLPDPVKNVIKNYVTSRQYFDEFFSKDHAWHIQNALMMHPKTGPVYGKMRTDMARLEGESGVYRQIENNGPQIGGGAVANTGIKNVGVDDFFS